MLPDRAVLLAINPFYHLIEILRDPLLGQPGSCRTGWPASA